MTKKTYSILNLIVIVGVVAWNGLSNSIGINGNTVGGLSDEYANLFTPAGYAFSIWGIIFLGLLALGGFTVLSAYQSSRTDDFIPQLAPWLILANLANAGWLWAWLTEYTGLSILIMLVILFSLLMVVIRLGIHLSTETDVRVKRWVWIPIEIYTGWITVATVANVSAYLAKIEWSAIFSEPTWAIIMIVIAALVNVLMVVLRRMRFYGGVGIWSLVAIAVRHADGQPDLAFAAWIGVGAIALAITWTFIRKKS